MAKKKITIDDLALMVKKGFDQTTGDLHALEQKLDLKIDGVRQEMADGFRGVNRRIDLLHDDISDLPAMREDLMEHDKRLNRVERKVGLAR